MKRTFCTTIRDVAAYATLDRWAELNARALPWIFRECWIRGVPLATVKRAAIVRFAITARQFNGLRFDLDQQVAAWRGGLGWRRERLKDQIAATAAAVGRLEARLATAAPRRRARLHFELHQKRRRRRLLEDRLAGVARDLAAAPRLCFGGRDLLRQGEVAAWRAKRASRIMLVGAACETRGNQTAQYDPERRVLRLRLPDAMGGGFLELADLAFRYGGEVVAANVDRTALTWLLFRDAAGRWQARVTLEERAAPVRTDRALGVLAVDLNADHLAVVRLDADGNPEGARLDLPFPVAGTPTGVADAVLGETIKALVEMAFAHGIPLAVEKLDFTKKKASLRSVSPQAARRLSGFAYARFQTLLASACSRGGVELLAVNPAYTSLIGEIKYAHGRAMSRHHAAALVIGRRALGMEERLVCMDGTALDGPARNRPRHRWSRWQEARTWLTRQGLDPRTHRAVGGGNQRGRARRGRYGAASGPGGATVSPGSTGRGPPQVSDAVPLADLVF